MNTPRFRKLQIYPAIDVRNGRVVRLLQGRAEDETVYFEDPAEPARRWREAGAEWVHVVDLDGAFSGVPKNWTALARVADTGLRVQMGGGLRATETVERAFHMGASRIVIGTRAVEDFSFLRDLVMKFGNRIAVGIDAREGRVATKGWVDTTDMTAFELAGKVADCGVRTVIYTDISRDGMLVGPNFSAMEQMLAGSSLNVIASGGVSSMDDLARFRELSTRFSNLEGVIIGKALYEGKIDLGEALRAT